jgi:hypothetical protein
VNAGYCPSCGAALTVEAPQSGSQWNQQTQIPQPPQTSYQQPAYSQPVPQQPTGRPTGVVILAILEAISGVFSLISGAVGSILPFGTVLGTVLILIGLLELFMAWSLYNGKSWARIAAIIIAIIGLLAIPIGTIISIIILYYLTRPNVKMFFNVKP